MLSWKTAIPSLVAFRVGWLAYGFALVAPFLVLWLYLFLGFTTVLYIQMIRAHTQQDVGEFVLFLVVVLLSAYLGGAGPGLVATVVTAEPSVSFFHLICMELIFGA